MWPAKSGLQNCFPVVISSSLQKGDPQSIDISKNHYETICGSCPTNTVVWISNEYLSESACMLWTYSLSLVFLPLSKTLTFIKNKQKEKQVQNKRNYQTTNSMKNNPEMKTSLNLCLNTFGCVCVCGLLWMCLYCKFSIFLIHLLIFIW